MKWLPENRVGEIPLLYGRVLDLYENGIHTVLLEGKQIIMCDIFEMRFLKN